MDFKQLDALLSTMEVMIDKLESIRFSTVEFVTGAEDRWTDFADKLDTLIEITRKPEYDMSSNKEYNQRKKLLKEPVGGMDISGIPEEQREDFVAMVELDETDNMEE
jgi:hypothetical protein